jgi:hypothetical protein
MLQEIRRIALRPGGNCVVHSEQRSWKVSGWIPVMENRYPADEDPGDAVRPSGRVGKRGAVVDPFWIEEAKIGLHARGNRAAAALVICRTASSSERTPDSPAAQLHSVQISAQIRAPVKQTHKPSPVHPGSRVSDCMPRLSCLLLFSMSRVLQNIESPACRGRV